MAHWSFLTNHARALLVIAHDPGVRLRDIAAALDITERSAYALVTELAEGGYVVKEKDGRRNRYEIQTHLPLRESVARSARSARCSTSSSRPAPTRPTGRSRQTRQRATCDYSGNRLLVSDCGYRRRVEAFALHPLRKRRDVS